MFDIWKKKLNKAAMGVFGGFMSSSEETTLAPLPSEDNSFRNLIRLFNSLCTPDPDSQTIELDLDKLDEDKARAAAIAFQEYYLDEYADKINVRFGCFADVVFLEMWGNYEQLPCDEEQANFRGFVGQLLSCYGSIPVAKLELAGNEYS